MVALSSVNYILDMILGYEKDPNKFSANDYVTVVFLSTQSVSFNLISPSGSVFTELGTYRLDEEGTWTYTVVAEGYKPLEETLEITEDLFGSTYQVILSLEKEEPTPQFDSYKVSMTNDTNEYVAFGLIYSDYDNKWYFDKEVYLMPGEAEVATISGDMIRDNKIWITSYSTPCVGVNGMCCYFDENGSITLMASDSAVYPPESDNVECYSQFEMSVEFDSSVPPTERNQETWGDCRLSLDGRGIRNQEYNVVSNWRGSGGLDEQNNSMWRIDLSVGSDLWWYKSDDNLSLANFKPRTQVRLTDKDFYGLPLTPSGVYHYKLYVPGVEKFCSDGYIVAMAGSESYSESNRYTRLWNTVPDGGDFSCSTIRQKLTDDYVQKWFDGEAGTGFWLKYISHNIDTETSSSSFKTNSSYMYASLWNRLNCPVRDVNIFVCGYYDPNVDLSEQELYETPYNKLRCYAKGFTSSTINSYEQKTIHFSIDPEFDLTKNYAVFICYKSVGRLESFKLHYDYGQNKYVRHFAAIAFPEIIEVSENDITAIKADYAVNGELPYITFGNTDNEYQNKVIRIHPYDILNGDPLKIEALDGNKSCALCGYYNEETDVPIITAEGNSVLGRRYKFRYLQVPESGLSTNVLRNASDWDDFYDYNYLGSFWGDCTEICDNKFGSAEHLGYMLYHGPKTFKVRCNSDFTGEVVPYPDGIDDLPGIDIGDNPGGISIGD